VSVFGPAFLVTERNIVCGGRIRNEQFFVEHRLFAEIGESRDVEIIPSGAGPELVETLKISNVPACSDEAKNVAMFDEGFNPAVAVNNASAETFELALVFSGRG